MGKRACGMREDRCGGRMCSGKSVLVFFWGRSCRKGCGWERDKAVGFGWNGKGVDSVWYGFWFGWWCVKGV